MLYIVKGNSEILLMNKISTVNARIDPTLKLNAENILHKVGLTTAEAIRLFYSQICLQNGLPFAVKIPNKETIQAMRDADAGKNLRVCKNVKELFDDLEN